GRREQTLPFDFRAACDDYHFIVIFVSPNFDHQCSIDNTEAAGILRFHLVQPLPLALDNGRMNQRVQLRTSLRIAEDDLSENLAANPSIGGKDAIAKSLNHGFIYGLARLKQFVRDPVGIDEGASTLEEHYDHRTLSRADTARELHPQ